MGLETRPKTKEHQESSQLGVRCTQLCQQYLLSWKTSFQVQTEMEFEINFSKVLQFLPIQKYKKLIYKHGTNGTNQSSHKPYLKNNMLMVNDKEPPAITKMLGLASKERAGENAFLLSIQQEAQARIAHGNLAPRRLFSCKCENCWGRQQNVPNTLVWGHNTQGLHWAAPGSLSSYSAELKVELKQKIYF